MEECLNCAKLVRERDELREHRYQHFLQWRDIEEPNVCKQCGGAGVKTYGSTSAWRGGAGGQMMTSAVCDKCWGSGDKTRPGANLRKLESELASVTKERDELRKSLKNARAIKSAVQSKARAHDDGGFAYYVLQEEKTKLESELAELKKANQWQVEKIESWQEQTAQARKELAEAKAENLKLRVGSDHYRSERDIHIKESEKFVTEATAKIRELSAQLRKLLEKCKEGK